jgi:hypothetical protein
MIKFGVKKSKRQIFRNGGNNKDFFKKIHHIILKELWVVFCIDLGKEERDDFVMVDH